MATSFGKIISKDFKSSLNNIWTTVI